MVGNKPSPSPGKRVGLRVTPVVVVVVVIVTSARRGKQANARTMAKCFIVDDLELFCVISKKI